MKTSCLLILKEIIPPRTLYNVYGMLLWKHQSTPCCEIAGRVESKVKDVRIKYLELKTNFKQQVCAEQMK